MKNTGLKKINTRKRSNMPKSDYYRPKIIGEVLVFSVFNVSELICGLMHVQLSRNLKKECMYIFQDPTFDLF